MGPPREDGYHPVRTLMVALDGLADRVELRPAARRRVVCPGVAERDNLAWRALEDLERELGRPLPGLEVRIDKRIPSEAGLGGGSSDAAATLVGANRLLGLGLAPEALERVAARVGSDVPFFVRGGAQWGEGRGERLRPASVPDFAALLVKPAGGLSTGAVYRAFDRLPAPASAPGPAEPPPFPALAGWVRNDLWPAALSLAPWLGAPARALSAAGARAVLLCGSGSCLAGLFAGPEAARAAAERLPAPGALALVAPAVSIGARPRE